MNGYSCASKHAMSTHVKVKVILSVHCRADKYTCTQLDRLARDYLRRNFETVVKCDGRPPNRVGLVNLSQTALMQILTDDSLELSSEVDPHLMPHHARRARDGALLNFPCCTQLLL